MTLTLGAHHACSAPTTFTIAKPLGLVIALSSIPNYVPRDVFSPVEYHGLGRINLGNAFGWLVHEALSTPSQLVYPLPDELTLLRVSPVQGMSVGIDEIVRPAPVTAPLMPWDRNGASWSMQFNSRATPAGTVTGMTYTVPAGKLLSLNHFGVRCARTVVATSRNTTTIQGIVNGGVVCQVIEYDSAIIGVWQNDALDGPILCRAGVVVSATYNCNDTGGEHFFEGAASGYLFDA